MKFEQRVVTIQEDTGSEVRTHFGEVRRVHEYNYKLEVFVKTPENEFLLDFISEDAISREVMPEALLFFEYQYVANHNGNDWSLSFCPRKPEREPILVKKKP
jgi:hypothetical protein